MYPFRYLVGLLGWEMDSSQDLCLHTTAQHRKMRRIIHVLSDIRTNDLNVRAVQDP
jgi:hypothetical protein